MFLSKSCSRLIQWFIDRLKKTRGFTSVKGNGLSFSLSYLDKHFLDGDIVSFSSLRKKGLVNKLNRKKEVKILSTGEITKKLILQKNKFIGHVFSGKYFDCGTMNGYINSFIQISKL